MQNAFKEWLLNAWVTWDDSKVFEKHAAAREVQMTSVVKTSSLEKGISASLEMAFLSVFHVRMGMWLQE